MSEDIPSGTSNYKIEKVDSSKGVYFLNPCAWKSLSTQKLIVE